MSTEEKDNMLDDIDDGPAYKAPETKSTAGPSYTLPAKKQVKEDEKT